MNPAFLIKLHPAGPWRFGPGEGGRDSVDHLYRSDRLFSAVTLAFERLGLLEPWLDATARSVSPRVVFSSLFPFQVDTLFAPPPAHIWPPPPAALRVSSPVFSTKVRWRAARFAPLPLIETLLLNQRILADQWLTDAESACLLRRDRPQSSPFRIATRTQAAIDRGNQHHETHSLACLEFETGSGLWAIVSFADESAATEWGDRVRAAFRLLADSGFGGRRSSGWGQVAKIDFTDGIWPNLLFPKLAKANQNEAQTDANAPSHWLLSLFTPGETDEIHWDHGNYSITTRSGYIDSTASNGQSKKSLRMIAEGSVVVSANAPIGVAKDVAPEGFAHPVYRSGFALSLPLPAVDFSAIPEEPAPAETELEQALFEAIRTAAEEDVVSIAEESARQEVTEFERAKHEIAPSESPVPEEEAARSEQPASSEEPAPTEEPLLVPPAAEEQPEIRESEQEPPSGKEDEPGHEL
jgi:CRISPR type III-A-associated RAMP protein Csm4